MKIWESNSPICLTYRLGNGYTPLFPAATLICHRNQAMHVFNPSMYMSLNPGVERIVKWEETDPWYSLFLRFLEARLAFLNWGRGNRLWLVALLFVSSGWTIRSVSVFQHRLSYADKDLCYFSWLHLKYAVYVLE